MHAIFRPEERPADQNLLRWSKYINQKMEKDRQLQAGKSDINIV